MQVKQIIVLLKRTNSNLSTGYAFRHLISGSFDILNSTEQVFEMSLMLIQTYQMFIYLNALIPLDILFHEILVH